MSDENKTPNTSPEEAFSGDVTEDIIGESRFRTSHAVHTKSETEDTLFIPEEKEEEDAAVFPAKERRFIKTDGSEFVSVRAEKVKDAQATELTKFSDRLDAAPAAEDEADGRPGKFNTYDTVHVPELSGRMINASAFEEEQMRMEGADAEETDPDETKEVSPEALAALTGGADKKAGDPTRHFELKTKRLREIADSADEDIRRNPDQMMMDGFEDIGKKTEEEIRADEALKDELQQSREKRVKNFRFWDKAPVDDTGETDEKFSHTKKMTALPSFAAQFSERFSHIPTPFVRIHSEEYTDAGNRKVMFQSIKKARARAFIGMLALAVFALILLITDLAAKVSAANNGGFFSIMGGSVNALVIFNLVFLLLSCGVMLPDLKNGAISVLKLRPKTDALLLFMMIAAVGQTAAAFFTQHKIACDFQLLAPAAVIVCIPFMLAKVFYYDNARQCFKTISAKSDKSYLRKVTDRELKARLGCNDEKNTVYTGKTRHISGFPASIESSARSEMPASRICAVFGGVSLIAAIVTLIVKKSVVCGLTSLTLCLALSLPVCCLVAAGFFLSRANAKLSLKSSFIQSFDDTRAFSAIDTFACDAADVFDASIVGCSTAKGVNEKQARFAAATVASGAGSLIKKVFANDIDTYSDRIPAAKNTVYEDKMGLSAYVGGCTVLLGNSDLLINHNVDLPENDTLLGNLNDNEYPLYLAMEGHFTAIFAVKYTAVKEVQQGVSALVNSGTALLLGTTDPNITDSAAEALLGLGENSVRIIGSSASKKLAEAKTAVADAEDAGAVFGESFLSFARVAAQAIRLDSIKTASRAIGIAGSFVSLLLGVVLSVTGAFSATSALTVLLLHAVWIGFCFLSPMFTSGMIKLLRRFSLPKKKAADDEEKTDTAEGETEETDLPAEDGETAPTGEDEAASPEEGEGTPPAGTEAEAESGSDTPFFEKFLDETDKTRPAPLSEEDAAAVEEALSIFAPKEEPAAPKTAVPEEASKSRFIASAALQDSLSSIGSFVDSLGGKPAYAKDGDAPGADFSLFGKDGAGRGARDAEDIENEYSRRKEEERALRSLFTAPDDPTAPIYDLHKKDEPAPADDDYETPLDTSDVSAFNDDLFRRFEDDDSVFAGLRDNDGDTDNYNF